MLAIFFPAVEKIGNGRTNIFMSPDLIDVADGPDVPHRSDTPDWAKPPQ